MEGLHVAGLLCQPCLEVADFAATYPVDVGVDQRHIVVAGYAVAQCRQPLVNALHHHLIRQAVPDVLQLCAQRADTIKLMAEADVSTQSAARCAV